MGVFIKSFLALFTYFVVVSSLYGQQRVEASGILFEYGVEGKLLKCSLSAPTKGWVGVGFNSKNSIVGSDLLLFNIVDGKVSSTDLYVKGVGNPIKDTDNGGVHSIVVQGGNESNSVTEVHFTIPMDSKDANDFVHILEKEAWLILAYSISDDFKHHSRIRKHLPFRIGKP